ncbi:MAG: radical SAM protein [Candidatus Omnitrophota bacterium]
MKNKNGDKGLFEPGYLKDMLGEGWYDIESDVASIWVWSKKVAFLKFPENHKGVSIDLSGCPVKGKKIELSLFDETKQFNSIYQLSENISTINVPEGTSNVRLEVSELWSPRIMLNNSDIRDLGIRLHDIRLDSFYKKDGSWWCCFFEKSSMSEALLKRLKHQNHILLQQDIAEKRSILRSFPIVPSLATDYLCNLRCRMCIQRTVNDSDLNMLMSKGINERSLIKFAEEVFPTAQVLRLNTAGEPLMSRTFDLELELADRYKVRLDLITNGTLLNAKKGRLKRLTQCTKKFTLSFDSPIKETYESIRIGANYSEVIENIGLFQKYKYQLPENNRPYFVLVMVLMKRNFKELPQMVEFAKKIGVDVLVAPRIVMHFDGMKEESLDDNTEEVVLYLKKAIKLAKELDITFHSAPFYHKYLYPNHINIGQFKDDVQPKIDAESLSCSKKLKQCPFLWDQVFINNKGTILPCCAPEPPIAGNIEIASFESIWNGEVYQKMRETFVEEGRFEHCYNCAKDGFLTNI